MQQYPYIGVVPYLMLRGNCVFTAALQRHPSLATVAPPPPTPQLLNSACSEAWLGPPRAPPRPLFGHSKLLSTVGSGHTRVADGAAELHESLVGALGRAGQGIMPRHHFIGILRQFQGILRFFLRHLWSRAPKAIRALNQRWFGSVALFLFVQIF